ncbi:hypothetical protein OAQ99_02220 [Candidatus Kapabacteria bacterium]|nr:hypothetical protein [Candidatus Kapabacteria bacterium]
MKTIIFSLCLILSINLYSQDNSINSNNNKKLMSVLGSFSSSNIYLSYLNVDMLAEQVLNKNIDTKKSTKILLSLKQVINQLDLNLRELHKLAESNEDAVVIYRLIYISEKMKEDTQNLELYIKDSTNQNLNKFKKSHNLIFNKLKSLSTLKNR